MPLANLAEVLGNANAEGYAVAGFVVLGWEDARAYVAAAESLGCPVILQAGPGSRAHTPIEILATMFRSLAEQADVPVVTHLDHAYEASECFHGIDLGFTSVMFDGSRKPIEQNIKETAKIVAYARSGNVSVEGEVGFVGYAEGEPSAMTSPEEVGRFAMESGADAVAVSIGNVHLQKSAEARIDFQRLRLIEEQVDIPLVLHGGSGIAADVRRKLATSTQVAKFNVGTEVRMAFGAALRKLLAQQPDEFDRIAILKYAERRVSQAAQSVLKNIFF